MNMVRSIALSLCLLAGAGCRAARSPSSDLATLDAPFANPELEYRFGERGTYAYAEDDRTVLTIEVRDARLYCNDRDTGPYARGTPVRILSRTELLVGGERRPIPPQPARRGRGAANYPGCGSDAAPPQP